MKHRNIYLTMMILAIAGLVIAGCSPSTTESATVEEPAAADSGGEDSEAAAEEPMEESMSEEPVTISMLGAANENDQLMIDALVAAYEELHPNVTFDIEIAAAGGSEVDNLVKTRLATGEMNEIFYYNSGSLLQALNPAESLIDLSGEAFMDNVVDGFKPAVAQGDGIFGVPVGFAAAGGVLYNKAVYAEQGLSVPTNWDEFVANNEALLAAGIPPVIQSFGDTWTAQLFVLADNYNVAQAYPNFAQDYTANVAKYGDLPEAREGFAHLQEGFESGWYQQDFATTTFEQGLEMLANGDAAQYPMLTQVVPVIESNWPDKINDIGFFALPGPDSAANGATLWLPLAFYAPQTAEHVDVIMDFFAFVASTDGTDAIASATTPAGPFMIKGASLPDEVLPYVNDLNGYIDSGNAYPALEFLSPIKGPNLEHFCVSVGTGQMTAEEAAANYDEDVKAQAQQLGIPGWDN